MNVSLLVVTDIQGKVPFRGTVFQRLLQLRVCWDILVQKLGTSKWR